MDGWMEAIKPYIDAIKAQREEIIKACVAKYGTDDPRRLVQCVQTGDDGVTRYWVHVMDDEELAERSKMASQL